MLEGIGPAIHWIGAGLAIGTCAAAVVAILRQQPRPTGRMSGKGLSLLTGRRYTIIVTIIYIGVMVLLWRPVTGHLSEGMRFAFDLVGGVLLLSGLTTYLWGMRTLGTMFGSSSALGVRLYTGHRLITNGPYRFIRHPMYAAVICASIGSILIYWTWSTLFFTISMFVVIIRAKLEEQALSEEFGVEWEAYKRRTPGWIPRF